MTDQNTNVYVGVQINLNKQAVNLVPTTPINRIEKEGIEFQLDKPIDLGKVGDALTSIGEDLGVPKEALRYFETEEKGEKGTKRKETGVVFIDNVIEEVIEATLKVEALSYTRPPGKKPDTKMLFAASAKFSAAKPEGFFKLNGFFFIIERGVDDKIVKETIKNSMKSIDRSSDKVLEGGENKDMPSNKVLKGSENKDVNDEDTSN